MLQIILIIIGFILLIKSADILVDGSSNIAKKWHIPEVVIGLTIVAIGTSMPELVVSVTAALEKHADLSIGNIIGSNITNMFLILGICSIIKPLRFKKETRFFEIPFTILTTGLLFFFCINTDTSIPVINRNEGIILLVLCILFIIYNLIMARKGVQFDKEDTMIEIVTHHKEECSIWEALFGVIVGIVGLKLGGDLVVNGAIEISEMIGITEKLVSLTVVALSTSLPELITSIAATKKGDIDLAIGNVLGSQIFNILLIIGISATLSPIRYSIEYNSQIILLIMGSIALGLFPFTGKKYEMTKVNGIVFVIIYVLYLGSLIYLA